MWEQHSQESVLEEASEDTAVQNISSRLTIGFTLSALDPGYVYLGPDATNANQCRCSSVYYSLLAACSVCQTRNFIK
jgi:hypothetical protein